MGFETKIHVYGSLRKYIQEDRRTPLMYTMQHPKRAAEVIKTLSIPMNAVQMVMVNHRAVSVETMIHPGDRVALFPLEYPLFVDWKDYRVQ